MFKLTVLGFTALYFLAVSPSLIGYVPEALDATWQFVQCAPAFYSLGAILCLGTAGALVAASDSPLNSQRKYFRNLSNDIRNVFLTRHYAKRALVTQVPALAIVVAVSVFHWGIGVDSYTVESALNGFQGAIVSLMCVVGIFAAVFALLCSAYMVSFNWYATATHKSPAWN